eukprot:TRINITY_DN8876_c0_g1_i3.p1 TRINITY_DN8876_c0_g1~~TRINITY_DN8876_c0_g1_i3.p1  ORF type:complete len:787 (-),score=94.23 TRINITY_DN8876_c0_g1_i3:624-2873(-)
MSAATATVKVRVAAIVIIFATLLSVGIDASGEREEKSTKYCIIGAGAAGIQLGHFLQREGLDYLIWERGPQAASFFRKYPIHRKLISINRRQSRSSNAEFNLRHDWNSLLEVNVTPFTNWTEEYFPSADILSEYLQEAADLQKSNIFYQHEVKEIERGSDKRFQVVLASPSGEIKWKCKVVVAAIGLWRPNIPKDWIRGLQNYSIGYHELAPWPGSKAFEGKSVLILGNGNGAFETADAVRNHAADIGILGRREERLAHETHYVGDVRSARATSMDSLQLKSLDDVFNIDNENGMLTELLPCAGSQEGNGWPQNHFDTKLQGFRGKPPVCILSDHSDTEFLLADDDPTNPSVKTALSKWGSHIHVRPVNKNYRDNYRTWARKLKGAAEAVTGVESVLNGSMTVLTMNKATLRKLATDSMEFRELLPGLMTTTQGLYVAHDRLRKPYDVVIRALGWKMELDAFKKLDVKVDKNWKYPEVSACFQSSEESLYFAGTVTHGYDKLRYGSAGGFIHGFRYTSKSLFRCLMTAYEGWSLWKDARTEYEWTEAHASEQTCENPTVGDKSMPSLSCQPAEGSRGVGILRRRLEQTPHWTHLLKRINEASGPYQMSCGALVDGIVYNKTARKVTYIQDVPSTLFDKRFKDSPRLFFMYRYGKKHNDLIDSSDVLRNRMVAFASAFLHPVLYFVQPGQTMKNSFRFHLVEDRWTDFSGREEVLGLHHFLSEVEKSVWKGTQPPPFHEKVDKLSLTCAE